MEASRDLKSHGPYHSIHGLVIQHHRHRDWATLQLSKTWDIAASD